MIPPRDPPWVKVLRELLLLFPFIFGGLGPVRVLAQDKQAPTALFDASMEEKIDVDSVYTASGYKQKLTEAPASITIATADEIRWYPLGCASQEMTPLVMTLNRIYRPGRSGDGGSRLGR